MQRENQKWVSKILHKYNYTLEIVHVKPATKSLHILLYLQITVNFPNYATFSATGMKNQLTQF